MKYFHCGLQQAIELGEVEKVEELLKNEPQSSKMIYRALFVAAGVSGRRASIKIAKVLLDFGANPYETTTRSETLLHSAAASGSLKMLQWILAQGLDPDARCMLDETPLHLLAKRSSQGTEERDSIKLLIHHGADFKAQNGRGRYPRISLSSYTNDDGDHANECLATLEQYPAQLYQAVARMHGIPTDVDHFEDYARAYLKNATLFFYSAHHYQAIPTRWNNVELDQYTIRKYTKINASVWIKEDLSNQLKVKVSQLTLSIQPTPNASKDLFEKHL